MPIPKFVYRVTIYLGRVLWYLRRIVNSKIWIKPTNTDFDKCVCHSVDAECNYYMGCGYQVGMSTAKNAEIDKNMCRILNECKYSTFLHTCSFLLQRQSHTQVFAIRRVPSPTVASASTNTFSAYGTGTLPSQGIPFFAVRLVDATHWSCDKEEVFDIGSV